MTTIIETMENYISEIVYHTTEFAVAEATYINECNKPSQEYNIEWADNSFKRAFSHAKFAIDICKDYGLDPQKVCSSCVTFIIDYKGAA